MELEIVYQDEYLIAINKPAGLLVHRSPMAKDATEFALQILRNQIGKRVYPTHRLDRKTSGVLLFALSQEVNSSMQKLFAERKVKKEYLAIVRGWMEDSGLIDYALKNEKGDVQNAITAYSNLESIEIDLPFGKHPTSRYSLIRLFPQTGRFHQLRKHMAHVFHPIIGDRPHGCNKQNRLWKEKFEMTRMLLHAERLEFEHPFSGEKIEIQAQLDKEFIRSLSIIGLDGNELSDNLKLSDN